MAGLALAANASSGCAQERKAPPAPKSRSLVVEDTSKPVVSAPLAPISSHAPAPKRRLCEGQLTTPGKDWSKPPWIRKSTPGARALAAELSVVGQWTWINFWAAWCVPCKEEIPRLTSWEKRLNQAGESFQLIFASMDDDERQLDAFLAAQSPDGLRTSYWLKNPEERSLWLGRVGAGADPDLPLHILMDPKGKIRCVIHGAVDDEDYTQVKSLVGR